MIAEWHYHGHYGKLGPLTREQIDELIEAGVILRDTWVWRNGMPDWLPASQVAELKDFFESESRSVPPPLPFDRPVVSAPPPFTRTFMSEPAPLAQGDFGIYPAVSSDKSRLWAGVFQFLIPGLGRMYLGYWAIGLLQFFLTCVGAGAIWSYVDGVVMLVGGVRMDGLGRKLRD